jgi:hypothetical protein
MTVPGAWLARRPSAGGAWRSISRRSRTVAAFGGASGHGEIGIGAVAGQDSR